MTKQLNDERAKHAYDFVYEISKKDEKKQKEFRSLVRSFPAMVQNNGLCTAVAFLQSKGKFHHMKLYEAIEKWLKINNDDNEGLMESIVSLDRDKYRMVSKEIMSYLPWVKRFSEGMLSGDES